MDRVLARRYAAYHYVHPYTPAAYLAEAGGTDQRTATFCFQISVGQPHQINRIVVATR
jgi:hypothetical protein